jgi:actin-related protein
MYVALQQLLALLSVGYVNGLVLDAGYDASYIVPIYEGMYTTLYIKMGVHDNPIAGYANHSAVARIDIGGRDLTDYMARLLKDRELPTTVTQRERAVRIKEQLCYVAQDFPRELEHLADVTRTYQLPDGQV